MMRKAIVTSALAALLVAALAAPAAAQRFEVRVNDQPVTLQDQPIAVGANILVPLRESLMAVGATDIRYLPSSNQVTFSHEGRQVTMNLSTRVALVDGTRLTIPEPIRTMNGRTYVRSEFLSQLDSDFAVVRVAGFRGTQMGEAPVPGVSQFTTFSVGGQSYSFSAPTWFMGDDLMVPLEESLSALGVSQLDFRSDLQVVFTFRDNNVLLNIMSGFAHIGGEAIPLSAPPVVRDGVVYVPASFINQLEPSFSIADLNIQSRLEEDLSLVAPAAAGTEAVGGTPPVIEPEERLGK